jgi:hypothetical protein
MEKRVEVIRKATLSQFLKVGVAAFAVGTFSSAHAVITLSDLNSVITINPANQSGINEWSIAGQDQLNQQWFWYRIGNSAEASIDTIGAPTVSTYNGTRGVTTTYANSQFTLQIDYLLTGGTAGSGSSDLAQTVRIINNTAGTLDFHFFTYSDFDLLGTSTGDAVNLTTIGGKYYLTDQTDGNFALLEMVNTPAANFGEAALYNGTLLKLNDGVADNLSNAASAGPGDVTWALQWDLSIAAGSSAFISKDTRIDLQVVPEPSTAALIGLGVIGFLVRRNRRS